MFNLANLTGSRQVLLNPIKSDVFIYVKYYIWISLLFFILPCCSNSTITTSSTDNNLVAHFNITKQNIIYEIFYKGDKVIGPSNLGFHLSNGKYSGGNVVIKNVERNSKNSEWRPVYGERNKYTDSYNETIITLADEESLKDELKLTFRAYKEGIAFRYTFINTDSCVNVRENTQFSFTQPAMAWVSQMAQDEIEKMPVGQISYTCERPVLIEYNPSIYLALGEAALVDFAPMKLEKCKSETNTLVASLTGNVKIEEGGDSPWRYIMVADSPAQLLENNYFLLNLNDSCKLDDISWIKPGKVIRETTLTTNGGLACVDFAEKYNLQFVEYDAGWYGFEYDENADATTVSVDPKRSKGPLNLQKVIDYGKSKGIGVILYVNKLALEKQLDEILPLYRSWGVAGIKFGFVRTGSPKWTSWLHEAVRKAAGYGLMVDIHDEYRPTGYSRTYPNLMTQEGIRGDEAKVPNEMVLNTLFTRMLAGAGDHTNCYFSKRVENNMGSHASQLAKTICIYSPWQFLFWYDRPEGSANPNIVETPELEFFSELPTVWDDTKVLEGYPGEYAIVARRKGAKWFIGALNGISPKEVNINLDFLDPGKEYSAKIYSDDKGPNTRTNVKIEKNTVTYKSKITKTVLERNGLAIIISPK